MANGGKYPISEILSWQNHTSILLVSLQPVLVSTYIANKVFQLTSVLVSRGQTAFFFRREKAVQLSLHNPQNLGICRGSPDLQFFPSKYKRKKAVWLHETTSVPLRCLAETKSTVCYLGAVGRASCLTYFSIVIVAI